MRKSKFKKIFRKLYDSNLILKKSFEKICEQKNIIRKPPTYTKMQYIKTMTKTTLLGVICILSIIGGGNLHKYLRRDVVTKDSLPKYVSQNVDQLLEHSIKNKFISEKMYMDIYLGTDLDQGDPMLIIRIPYADENDVLELEINGARYIYTFEKKYALKKHFWDYISVPDTNNLYIAYKFKDYQKNITYESYEIFNISKYLESMDDSN